MSLGQWRPVQSVLKTSQPVRRKSDASPSAPTPRVLDKTNRAAPLKECGDEQQVEQINPSLYSPVDKYATPQEPCDKKPQFDWRLERLGPVKKHQADDH